MLTGEMQAAQGEIYKFKFAELLSALNGKSRSKFEAGEVDLVM